jgi:hypothetical protein
MYFNSDGGIDAICSPVGPVGPDGPVNPIPPDGPTSPVFPMPPGVPGLPDAPVAPRPPINHCRINHGIASILETMDSDYLSTISQQLFKLVVGSM